MAKPKRNQDNSGDLLNREVQSPKPKAQSPTPPEPKEIPKVLEYTPLGSTEKWRVERFAELEAEMGILRGMGSMMGFHELGMLHPRPWLICQRLFGISPMVLPANADPSEYEVDRKSVV